MDGGRSGGEERRGQKHEDVGTAVAAVSVRIAEPGFLQKGTWSSETTARTLCQRAQVSQSLTMINSKAGTLMLNDPQGKGLSGSQSPHHRESRGSFLCSYPFSTCSLCACSDR